MNLLIILLINHSLKCPKFPNTWAANHYIEEAGTSRMLWRNQHLAANLLLINQSSVCRGSIRDSAPRVTMQANTSSAAMRPRVGVEPRDPAPVIYFMRASELSAFFFFFFLQNIYSPPLKQYTCYDPHPNPELCWLGPEQSVMRLWDPHGAGDRKSVV